MLNLLAGFRLPKGTINPIYGCLNHLKESVNLQKVPRYVLRLFRLPLPLVSIGYITA